MNKFILIALLATSSVLADEESPLVENNTIEDYISVAELKSVDSMRMSDRIRKSDVTEYYIILDDRKEYRLLQFVRRCRELNEVDVTPDFRHDSKSLRARFDTYRGCRIKRIYEITAGQAKEIAALGKAAGRSGK